MTEMIGWESNEEKIKELLSEVGNRLVKEMSVVCSINQMDPGAIVNVIRDVI